MKLSINTRANEMNRQFLEKETQEPVFLSASHPKLSGKCEPPVRMAIINGSDKNCWRGCVDRNCYSLLMGVKVSIAVMETTMEVLQN